MKNMSDPRGLARSAARDFSALYGDDCRSVLLYGSAAGGDFNPKKSDINLLVVLGELTLAQVNKSHDLRARLLRAGFAAPLYMDEAYIKGSLDTFPVEFFNIKGCYQVLEGKDIFAGMNIEKRYLRLQLERELKGKWLHLVQGWLDANGSRGKTRRLIRASLHDFAPSLRVLVHLKGEAVPHNRSALFTAVCSVYGLSENAFERVNAAADSGNKSQMLDAFPGYVATIKKLSEIIDTMSEKEDV